MRVRNLFSIGVAVALMIVLRTPVQAQAGKATIDKLVQVFTHWSGSPKDTSAYVEASRYIDYTGMAQRSLTPAEWNKLSAEQKAQLAKTLRALIEQRYYTRWHKIFNKGKVIYESETASGGDTVVKTQLNVGKKVDQLEWRLDNGGTKVVSLSIGEADLLKKLSARLQGRLNKYGFDGLLTWLKGKANIGPSQEYEEASTNNSAH